MKYCADNGTPQTIRTDNGSCFKSKEFKEYCNGENITRILCTPNLHTGTGLVERTIRTIKSLTRASLEDDLTFEESVNKAIKTIRQTQQYSENDTFPITLREKTTHADNQSDWPTKLPINELEENTNKLHFSPACRITSLYDTRLRWRTGRLFDTQWVKKEGTIGKRQF